MDQVQAVPWTELLKLDVYTLLHSAGLHEEADHVSQELQAAIADRGLSNEDTSAGGLKRLDNLRRKAEAYELCFGLLQRTCGSHLESGIAPMQQKMWRRSLDVSRDFLYLHNQQRKQLESWSSRYKGLRQEHQVLRSNLRSLKLTVQQLLTDVSTLLQHTASARQQQQQQEALQQQDAGLSSGWSKHAGFQQHLQRTGFALPHGTNATPGAGAATAAAGATAAAAATHRGVQGGRRCVSADGSAPKSDGAVGADTDSHASLVAMTMQRLIGSIERMSRHFADCQAGKLIEDYSSGLANTAAPATGGAVAAAAGGQPVDDAAAVATGAGAGGDPTADARPAAAAAASNSGVHSRRNSSSCHRAVSNGSREDGNATAPGQVSELDIIKGSGRPGSSNGSSTASTTKPRPIGSAVRTIPRPPSSGSGSSGSSSGRPGLRAPTAPVLGGVAAAAAAISNAMASASAPKTVSSRPGAQRTLAPGAKALQQGCIAQDTQDIKVSSTGVGRSHQLLQVQQPLKQRQELVQAQGLQGVKTDDAMRHSFDTERAKAAADAWFAQKARGSVSILDSAAESAAAAADGTSRGSCNSSAAAAVGGHGDTSGSGKDADCAVTAEQGQQQQREVRNLQGQAVGVTTGTAAGVGAGANAQADALNLAREASSGSSNLSSLGPSISEVWQAAEERTETTAPEVSAAAGNADDGVDAAAIAQSAAAAVRHLQQQTGLVHARTAARLPPQGPSTGRPSRQPAASAVIGAAGGSRIGSGINAGGSSAGTAAAVAGARLSVRSSGGSASNGSSVWGSGCSHTKQASRPTGPIMGRSVVMPSGPLTAALHSSAARWQANSATNACNSSSAARESTGSLTKGSSVKCGSATGDSSSRGRGFGCDGASNSWAGAGTNSRSGSSCSYRSGGSSGYSSSNTGSMCAQAGAAQAAVHGLGAHAGALRGAYTAGGRMGRATTGPGSNTSSPASDGVLFGSGNSSAANSPAGSGAARKHGSPAGADRQLPAAALTAADGVAGAPKAVRSLDWSGPVQGGQQVGADTALGPAVTGARHAQPQQQQQQQGRQLVSAGQLPPRPPAGPYSAANQAAGSNRGAQHYDGNSHLLPQPGAAAAATAMQQVQQLAVQHASQCVLASRVQTGLLSPIVEEVSCNTTPRTSASDPTEGVRHVSRGAFSSSGTCRGSSKLSGGSCAAVRVCISDDGTPNTGSCVQQSSNGQQESTQALPESALRNWQSAAASGVVRQQAQRLDGDASAGDAPDAFKGAGRGGSPKVVRAGSISPPDTAVGKDTAPAAGSNSSSPWHKQGVAQQDKHQWQQQQQGQHRGVLGHTAGTAGADQEIQPEGIQVSHATMHGATTLMPRQGNVSNPQSLAAFPLDMGLTSHSLDSLDTVLIDTTSCCQSDEDNCADLAAETAGTVGRAGNTEGNGGNMRATVPAAGDGAVSVDDCVGDGDAVMYGPVRAAGCMLDLQDLLAIVLDVMNDKQAADKRYMASGLGQPTLGRHLQCYVAAKVHSNQAAYSSAMSAILTGLEQHKQVQPEVAVFCRVLSDELDEDYFHHRHLGLRQQLQHLATQAALSSTQPREQQQQQQVSDLWEDCCSMPLDEARLQGMLKMWAVERGKMVQVLQKQQLDLLGLAASWELDIRQHCGCGPIEAVRAGSAVAALLLWELDQQLQHLRPIANAFRTADVSCRGVLSLEDFKVFCRRLNQALSDEEIQVLFYQEMRVQQHAQVTFSAICRALLPAM